MPLFLCYEPNKKTAEQIIKEAHRHMHRPPLLKEAVFELSDSPQAIPAAMDEFLRTQTRDTWFVVYDGHHASSSHGHILFTPASMITCKSYKQVLTIRKNSTHVSDEPEELTYAEKRRWLRKVWVPATIGLTLVAGGIAYATVQANASLQSPFDTYSPNADSSSSNTSTLSSAQKNVSLPPVVNTHVAPQQVQIEHLSSHGFTISFTPVSGATSYDYNIITSNGTPTTIDEVPATSESIQTAGPNETYTCQVRALFSINGTIVKGPWSHKITTTTYIPWSTIIPQTEGSVVKVAGIHDLSFQYDVGTGFFIPGGYILTDWHVVKHYRTFLHIDIHGFMYPAMLIAHSETDDLALLKPLFYSAPAGLIASQQVQIGMPITYFGYSLGHALHVSSPHLVTGTNDTIQVIHYGTLYDELEFTGGVEPGDSGGPVLNHYGQVVGIVDNAQTATSPSTYGKQGVDGANSMLTIDSFLASAIPNDLSLLQQNGY